jgi:hypothetical protein
MGRERIDAEAAASIEAIKAAIREMHEVIQEAKEVRRQLLNAIGSIAPTIDSLITDEVVKGLEQYQEQLSKAIDAATERIDHRFDTLGNILLGNDSKSIKRGEPALPEIFEFMKLDRPRIQQVKEWMENNDATKAQTGD